MRRTLALGLAMFFIAIANATAATTDGSPAPSVARCELNDFVDQLGTIPSLGVDPAEAKNAVAAMSDEEAEAVRAGMGTLGNWQQLPVVMASLEAGQQQHQLDLVARIAEAASGRMVDPDSAEGLELFRGDMLYLIDQLDRFAPVMQPDFQEGVRHVRDRVGTMPLEAVKLLREKYLQKAPEWRESVDASMIVTPIRLIDGIAKLGPINVNGGCGSCCSDVITCVGCWIDLVGCLINEVGNLVNQVAAYVGQITTFVTDFFNVTLPSLLGSITSLPGQVASFFTQVFNNISSFVTTQFNSLIAAIPDTVNEVLAFIGVNWNNVDWNAIASSIPTIAPPCPQQAVDIAAEVCDRGGDALTQLLFDVAPDDGLSFAFKLGAGLIHYPLAYLCQCNDIQQAIAFADAQAAHRELTGTRLDLKLSTRATQSSVNALSASLTDLDSDVAKVEAKLDTLEATTSRIETNVNRIEKTVERIESNVNHIESTTNSTEAKVDLLTSGNTDQQQFLDAFIALMERLNIEENMLHIKPDVISLFQLSSAFGGKLETVALIVADTIQMNLNANQLVYGAERELQRGDSLRAVGDFVRAYEAYRSAYTEAVK